MRNPQPPTKARVTAFSLVELMIALLIGLLVVFGATQLLLSTIQSHRHLERVADLRDTILYSASLIGRDIRSAEPGVACCSNQVANRSGTACENLSICTQDEDWDADCSGDDNVAIRIGPLSDGIVYAVTGPTSPAPNAGDGGRRASLGRALCRQEAGQWQELATGLSNNDFAFRVASAGWRAGLFRFEIYTLNLDANDRYALPQLPILSGNRPDDANSSNQDSVLRFEFHAMQRVCLVVDCEDGT